MACIMCLCDPEGDTISCKRYGCDSTTCAECANAMVSVCYESIRSMPTCECECEYLSSQLRAVLSAENMGKYVSMCKRINSETVASSVSAEDKAAAKKELAAMFESVRTKVRNDLREALPPAIVKLMAISGFESKLVDLTKREKLKQKNANLSESARVVHRKCVSFICNGRLIEEDDYLECASCKLLVCKKCDAVRSKTDHVCRTEDVESVAALKLIATCPNCNVKATKGDGCVFVTCPFCKTNFDSTTGQASDHGGHNIGGIRPMVDRKRLTDIAADGDASGKLLLSRIQNTKRRFAKEGRKPDETYELRYKLGLYTSAINRIYELRDVKMLTEESLTNIANYLENL